MDKINFPILKETNILSLGAESAGRFCFYHDGEICTSPDFGDILDFNNFRNYEKAIYEFIKRNKPDLILTDLHPLYNSTVLGEELSKKLKIPRIKVQHHLAHIFSAIGDDALSRPSTFNLPRTIFGIAMDGTGYGLDGNIWGGEVFKIKNEKCKMKSQNAKDCKQHLNIERIGSLEEQTMIGGDLAVREPARMLIAILSKTKNQKPNTKATIQNTKIIKPEDDIYKFVKKYYTRNEFELLYNQLKQNFNCQQTTSTGRVLDAVSVLLGFTGNKRNFKHEAAKLLEKNSTAPYNNCDLRFTIYPSSTKAAAGKDLRIILDTTHLFEYLINNLHKDKKRLAATSQLYLARGLYEIIYLQATSHKPQPVFAGGGMANNKIISAFFEKRDLYLSKKIPRGDEGIAFGQLFYYLFTQ